MISDRAKGRQSFSRGSDQNPTLLSSRSQGQSLAKYSLAFEDSNSLSYTMRELFLKMLCLTPQVEGGPEDRRK